MVDAPREAAALGHLGSLDVAEELVQGAPQHNSEGTVRVLRGHCEGTVRVL